MAREAFGGAEPRREHQGPVLVAPQVTAGVPWHGAGSSALKGTITAGSRRLRSLLPA